MAERIGRISQHLLPQSCASHAPGASMAVAPLESPTGRIYPPGTDTCLMGNMEPVYSESVGELTCVHGALPTDIDGFFLRNGPNPALEREGRPYHAFEGDAMIHSCEIRDGKATYRNRWVQTKRLTKEREVGKELTMQDGLFDEDGFIMGAQNTSVIYHAGQLLSVYETDRPYKISLPELETQGQLKRAGWDHSMTAHPKICSVTGEMCMFGYDVFQPMIHYGVVSPQGELTTVLDIPTKCGKPVMMHDMAITSNFSVILEFPFCFDPKLAMRGQMPYEQDTSLPSWIGVLPRHAKSADEIRWFKAHTGMAFHTANAWEEGDLVKLVAVWSQRFVMENFNRDGDYIRLHEWTLNMKTGEMTERDLCDVDQEFVQINAKYVGQKNQYVWAAHFSGATPGFLAIEGYLKNDLASGSLLEHPLSAGRFGGEAVFAARANAKSEDDGYLLTFTYNPKDNVTELYVVDAKSMDQDPVAILRTPYRVPFGFHAYWLPKEAM